MGNGVELVAFEWIVNVVFSRSNVNIIRKPFLSIAVMGGMAAKNEIISKNRIQFSIRFTISWMILL